MIGLFLLLRVGAALAAPADVSSDVSPDVSADASRGASTNVSPDVSARSLFDLGLPVVSEATFVGLLDRGPADPTYDEALDHLVRIALLTDDWSLLRARILAIPVDRWPKRHKDALAWLRARALFADVVDGADEADPEAALTEARRLLNGIPLSSELAIRARYLAGLVASRLGKPHLAHHEYVDVLRAVARHDGELVSEARSDELDRSREHAVLAIARLYAHAGLDRHAVGLTRHIPLPSPVRAELDLLLAWVQPGVFRKPAPSDALGPAVPRLEALLHDASSRDVCTDRAGALRQLAAADARFGPIRSQVAAVLARWTTEAALDDPDLQRLEWIHRHAGDPGLPVELRAEIASLAEVATVRRKLARVARERSTAEAQRAAWRPGAVDAAKATLDAETARLERLGGTAVLAKVVAEEERLGALLDGAGRAAASIEALSCPGAQP